MTANFKFCLSTSIVHEIKCMKVLLRYITIVIAVITTHIVNAMVILFPSSLLFFTSLSLKERLAMEAAVI